MKKKLQIEYADSDKETLTLSNERIKFHISGEEMESLNLTRSLKSMDTDVYDYNEMVVLAAILDDYEELEPGDIIWAKLTGTCLDYLFIYFTLQFLILRGHMDYIKICQFLLLSFYICF